jgi:hypothetical protein
MNWTLDARLPLRLIAPAEWPAARTTATDPGIALLLAEGLEGIDTQGVPAARFRRNGPRHALACACCAGRPPVAEALDRLFQARVRGACAWFGSVVALVPDDETRAEIEAALQGDALTRARFKPG